MKRFLFLLLFSIFCSFNATAQWDEIDWGWDIDQWQNWYDEYWDDGECIDYGTGFCDEQNLDEVDVCGNCDDPVEEEDPFIDPCLDGTGDDCLCFSIGCGEDPDPDPCEENPEDCYGDDGGGSGNNGDEEEEEEEDDCVNGNPAGEGAPISSDYGDTTRPPGSSNPHDGVDYDVPTGTPVTAMAGGNVIRSGWSDSYGWVMIIDHGQGVGTTDHIYTIYAHLQSGSLKYSVNENVNTNDVIANVNNSGKSTSPHLHVSAIQSPSNIALTTPFYSKSKKINPHNLVDKVSDDCN